MLLPLPKWAFPHPPSFFLFVFEDQSPSVHFFRILSLILPGKMFFSALHISREWNV